MEAWVRRLVIVEDDALMRSLLTQLLGERTFDVKAAGSVSDAVRLLEDFDPDVVLIGEIPPHYAFLRKDLIDDVSALDAALEAALREAPGVPRHDRQGSPLSRLTDDQFHVLRMVAEGWTNASIATARGTSERSVERLLHAAFDALRLPDSGDVNRRVDAVRMFITYAGVPPRRPAPT